ncbi:MAG: DUF2817 domain-containing protein [Hyphomonadaceae bacterium]|nr:DUF2817 domain-containing protein [Hyphomonadaceae bacterium]
MRYFAESYAQARGFFLTAATEAGAAIETLTHPSALSPSGGPLCMDVARVGRADASNVLFMMCGTHGVEGYPGSAAFTAFLAHGLPQQLPPHVAIVILHGLNPYGWSRDSQRNEDGIDINRNFLDFTKPLPAEDQLHKRFSAILDIDEMSFGALDRAAQAIFATREQVGAKRFMDALAGGQYNSPRGIKFGGQAPAWSNLCLRRTIREYLARAERIASLDWHTGLGGYGELFTLCFSSEQGQAYQKTSEWWGAELVRRGAQSWSPAGESAPSPDITGSAWNCIVEEAPQAQIAGGVIEFGTVSLENVLQGVVLDHWLTFNAPADPANAYWRAQMRAFFAPREPSWERSVARHSERVCAASLAGLTAWTA